MKHFKIWVSALALVSLLACTREQGDGFFRIKDRGVFGYLTPVVDDTPDTRAFVEPENKWKYNWEIGDRVNIWSNDGTLLVYKVVRVDNDGRALFDGGGFKLEEGKTYYSSHPLVRNVLDDHTSLYTTYEGQVQGANNDGRNLAEFTYTYSSAPCEDGGTVFYYHHLSSFFRFYITVPKAMTLTELTLTADDEIFSLDGRADMTAGTFTSGRMSDVMTLGLDNIELKGDNLVLKAYMAIAPCAAASYVIRVKDSGGKVYTSPVISKGARNVGAGTTFETEVFEGENPVVAKIGDVTYQTLAEAIAAVPADGTQTTITMVGDHAIEGNAGLTIPTTKNVVLDLNSKTVTLNITAAKASQLFDNLGTLTITDNSTGKTGKLTNAPGDGLPVGNWPELNFATNIIKNSGTLNIEGGTIINNAQGSICYAIDNNSTSYDTILNITGGTITGTRTLIRQFCNSTTKQNVVNISGGTIETTGSTAMWTQLPGSNGQLKLATLNITGGVIKATNYAWYDYSFGDSFEAVNYSISGGEFFGAIECAAVDEGGKPGFITGGKYSVEPNAAYLANGYKTVENGDYFIVVEMVPVAQIEGVVYETLEDAVAAAEDGQTITLVADCTGNGIVAPQGKFGTSGLTIDFDGHSYTVDGNLVGSTGTETLGMQLLMGNKITLKKGSFTSSKAKMLIQNYSDLTLENMTLSMSNANYAYAYTLSNNNGTVVIDGSTINANTGGGFAFDVCRYASYSSVNVSVLEGSVINGNVEVSASGSDPKDGFSLTLTGGTLSGDIVLDGSAKTAMANYPDKAVITKSDSFAASAPAGYGWASNGDGTSTLKPIVAQVGGIEYATLEAAVAAATDGQTITLVADCAGNGIVAPQGKFGTSGLTIDFNGHSYTVDGNLVGSTGTETLGMQLLMGNKITLKNGSFTSSKAKMLIQNYSDLTLENMTLSMSNANYAYAYTLSNNNGTVVIDGSTINANTGGGFAFDVCRYASYSSVNVSVLEGSVINGNVEVSASGSDPKDGFSLTLTGGTLSGDIVLDGSAKTAMANYPDKAVITKSDSFTASAPAGYGWSSNGDGTSTLKPIVAQVGGIEYATLEAAVAAATDGQTITITADCAGNGIVAPQGKFTTSGLTIDFNGHTYDFSGAGVGSTGTQNNGFQLLKDNTVTFKNGTLTASSEDAGFLIQNYSNLTLENMTVDGSNVWGGYTLSNNNGDIVIKNSTIIAPSGGFAFDVCRYASYPSVNVSVTEGSTITGDIEVSASGSDPKDGFSLTLANGTLNGNIVLDGSAKTAMANNPSKAVIKKSDSFTANAPAGYDWFSNGDGTSTLKLVAAQIGGIEYATLEDAFAAAQDGQTITLVADCAGNGIVAPEGKFTSSGLTIDFGGHTYDFSGDGVGSTGTQNNGFQLLKDNTVTFKNGTLTASSEDAGFLIQNYSNLTLQNMTVDGTNVWGGYTLSNNNGTVVIDNSTIIAPAGGVAFDVCRYANYPSVNVTVKGNSTITGDVEVSVAGSDPKDGLGLTLTSAVINGNLNVLSNAMTALANNPSKVVIKKSDSVTVTAPTGTSWVSNGDGTSTLQAN